jgi:hypothetical protein
VPPIFDVPISWPMTRNGMAWGQSSSYVTSAAHGGGVEAILQLGELDTQHILNPIVCLYSDLASGDQNRTRRIITPSINCSRSGTT